MTSLNPVFTVERQLSEPLRIHQGMSKAEAKKQAVTLLSDVKIPNPEVVAKQYPHQLSGGMRQRVMIAMALACKPKILIADEPTTALDVTIQAQILKLMNELKEKNGTAVLFITHDLGVINQMADDVAVMYCGQVVEFAPARDHLPRGRVFPPLHRGAPGLHPAAGYARQHPLGGDPRRGAAPARPAQGLQVRPPLQVRHGALPPGRAGADPRHGGAADPLLPPEEGGQTWITRERSCFGSTTSSSIFP